MTTTDFIVLGASLDTGNLGVSALLAGTAKCIRRVAPTATISLLAGARGPSNDELQLAGGQRVLLGRIGVRQNKAVWRANHVLRLLLTAALARLLPVPAWRRWLLHHNPYLAAMRRARCCVDISGGDSFSDIYGMRRFLLGTLCKCVVLLTGSRLVLLPQTYGPFRHWFSRSLARYVLRRAAAVYARDRESLRVIADLMGGRSMRAVPQFSPDMAFVLDAVAPASVRTYPAPLPHSADTTLIGFNVSGLLYHGGYTRNNMFGLRAVYPLLVRQIADALLARSGTMLLFVPHVFVPSGHVESDAAACRDVCEALTKSYAGRVFCLEGEYDQSEIKQIIGRCDFFIGSRMHACIAAASQGIATVPLAYSRKFRGVFETVGAADWAIDLRTCGADEALSRVCAAFDRRIALGAQLEQALPRVQQQVLGMFDDAVLFAMPDEAGTLAAGVS